MKRGLFLGAVVSHLALFSQGISTDSLDKEEAFMVRRITEFWKDQDYQLVERQIFVFLEKYPDSVLKDYLKGILGDIYLKDRNFEKAIDTYLSIQDSAIQEKVLVNALQAMYELSRYTDLHKTGSKYLTHPDLFEERKEEFLFLVAEGYFRSSLDQDEPTSQPLLLEAKKIYEKLLKTSYADPSQFALAEIYKKTNEPQKSAELFKKLASKYKDKKEELLFHAGLAESTYSPKEAIDTFSEVVEMRGSRLYTSAFNRLVLMFQLEAYEAVINSIDIVLVNADPQTLPVVLYMYSRSLFGAKMYEKALEIVDRLEARNALDDAQKKNLYLIELGSSQQLKELQRYEKALKKFEAAFPKDKEIPKAIFIHALLLKEQLKTQEAQSQLEKILKQFSDFESADSLLLEYGLVTYDNEQYELSRTSLKSFIDTFPSSDQIHLAWRYYLSGTLQLYDLIQKEEHTVEEFSKIQFYSDLSWILSNAKGLSDKEIQESRFLQAKVGYDLGYTQESMQKLVTYIQDYSKHNSLSDAHLLIALCYDRMRTNYENFIQHADKSIQLAQKQDHISSMHIQIFNALLRYKESLESQPNLTQAQSKRLKEIQEKAAEHLYAAFLRDDLDIRKENLLWLSNIFYDQAPLHLSVYEKVENLESALPENLAKAKKILQKILIAGKETFLNQMNSAPSLEWDMMRLVRIAHKEGNIRQKQIYLEILADSYRKNAHTWSLRQEALIELSKIYELQGNKKQALETLDEAVSVSSTNRTMASEYARIHKIRLEIEHLENFNQAQIEEKINYLKGLQIQKDIGSEPLHLEASLVYAEARTYLSEELEKDLKHLFFLNRVKEDYNNPKDPQVLAYKSSLGSNQKLKVLYDEYMQVLDIEMHLAKYRLELAQDHGSEANVYKLEGLKLLSKIKKEPITSHYVRMKVQELQNLFE
ncbi:MAG: hypothetical protein FJZ62_02135 [Chlamydiae bacterium]|nr:hypothetical protein [Chlamydiota bacterium]